MKGIQNLVLNGRLDEAIDLTYQLFPGILERNPNLLFSLKVRQFIEMIINANSHQSPTKNSEKNLIDENDSATSPKFTNTPMMVDSHEQNGAQNGLNKSNSTNNNNNTTNNFEETMGLWIYVN